MFNIIEVLNTNLVKPKSLETKDKRIPSDFFYLSPSSAMCYDEDGRALGACIRKVWLDKKRAPRSRPMTAYNQYQFIGGLMWEKWLIDQYKDIGIYKDSNVPIVDNTLRMAGELDIVHTNPINNRLEFTECKTYNGSAYNGTKDLLGSNTNFPKPKDAHLLQVVCYLMMLKDYDITHGNLVYIDKSLGKLWNHKSFSVFLEGNKVMYDTLFKGVEMTLEEDRFTTDSILEKHNACIRLLELDTIPDPDFKQTYTYEDVQSKYNTGELTKYKYDKVMKEELYPEQLCDYQCDYCPYGKNPETGLSTCADWV